MFRNSSKVTHGKTERERERERKKERKKGIMKITTQKKAISIKKPQTDIVLLQNIKHEHGRKHKHKGCLEAFARFFVQFLREARVI